MRETGTISRPLLDALADLHEVLGYSLGDDLAQAFAEGNDIDRRRVQVFCKRKSEDSRSGSSRRSFSEELLL
jgi:hypothetical protein